MMEAEMNEHLGYAKSDCFDSYDYCNDYKTKRVNNNYCSMEIHIPQGHKSIFEPTVVKKYQKTFLISTRIYFNVCKSYDYQTDFRIHRGNLWFRDIRRFCIRRY